MQAGCMLRQRLVSCHRHGVITNASRTKNFRVRHVSTTMAPEEVDLKFFTRNYNPDGVRGLEGVEFVRGSGSRIFDSKGREYGRLGGGYRCERCVARLLLPYRVDMRIRSALLFILSSARSQRSRRCCRRLAADDIGHSARLKPVPHAPRS